jgi:hypothetical protein
MGPLNKKGGARMASQTFLGRDMFAGYWGVTLSGFLLSSGHLTFPIKGELQTYARSRRRFHKLLLGKIKTYAGLADDIVAIAEREAPWSDNINVIFDDVEVCMEVGILLERFVEPKELLGPPLAAELVIEAAHEAVAQFFDAFVSSVFSFGCRSVSMKHCMQEVSLALADILDKNSKCRHIVVEGGVDWVSWRLPTVLEHQNTLAEYRAWLLDQFR